MTKWILNASPLIILGLMEQLHLISALCDDMIIPHEVADEIFAGPGDDPARSWIESDGKRYIKPSISRLPVIASWDLGKGESAVLTWGYQHRDWEIVLDDGAARKCAQALGIRHLGTIGVILRAKRQALIPQAAPLLLELPAHGFRIAQSVLTKALKLAGESPRNE